LAYTQGVIRRLRHPIPGYAFTLVLLVVCTGMIALIRWAADVGNISMMYLLVVIAAAVVAGRGPAVAAAVAAFLAYDYFFIPPRYTFTVRDEAEWIALALLLLTGIVTGQLAVALRDRALEAERREREAVVMYDVVNLMTEPDLQRALTAVAERLRTELGLAAVVMAFGRGAPARVQADVGDAEAIRLAHDEAADRILAYGRRPTGAERGKPGRWVRVVQPRVPVPGSRARSRRVRSVAVDLDKQRVGTIVVVRTPEAPEFSSSDDRLVSALARQLSLALERLRLQREATEAEILRRTDELRTALMNAVSHDLRTPLASIIASAGSLLQEDVQWSDDERREFLQAIEHEAERLNRLVGNLLDLSRIEAGNLRPEKGWYDIAGLVNEVAGRLRFLTSSHRLTLDVPEDLPPVEFDYVEIDQVLTNLIENAIKYTPPATEIAVSVRRAHDGAVQVEVADNGPGIPPEALPRLFDPFFRAPSTTVRPQGSGLGLAVVKGLVEAHGGKVWAENRTEGGARFVFTLPASAVAVSAVEQQQRPA
jgi:two-component system sensor histidine kinase KdpD